MSDYCPRFKAALLANDNDGKPIANAARCKMWSCEFCASENRKQWQAVLFKHIENSGNQWSWFTLTAHSNAHKTSDPSKYTLMNLKRAWDTLMKRMRRKFGNFSYCRVYEKHASGAFHLHCIRSGEFDDLVTRRKGQKNEYTDSAWLRKNATNLGLGYMTHAGNLGRHENKRVVFYVIKYMTKIEPSDADSWRNIRRIQTSRDIKFKQPAQYAWKLKSGLYLHDVTGNENTPYLLPEKRLLNTDDFLDAYAWPPDEPKI